VASGWFDPGMDWEQQSAGSSGGRADSIAVHPAWPGSARTFGRAGFVSRRAYPARAAARPQPTPRMLIASASWRAYRRSNSTRGWDSRKASRYGLALALGVPDDPAGCNRRAHRGRRIQSEGWKSVFAYFDPGTAVGGSEKRSHTRPGWRSLWRKCRYRAVGSGGMCWELQKRAFGQKKRFSGACGNSARHRKSQYTLG
jgi:hypothetical protein